MPWKQPVALGALTLALAAGVAKPSSRNHGTPPTAPPTGDMVKRLTLTCGGREARLEIETPEVVPVSPEPQGTPGQPSSLYIVRVSWNWLALADDKTGYGRVTLGVAAEPGTILDLYPHEMHAANPVSGELRVDARQRFQVVPKGSGMVAIAPSIERLHGHRHGSWVYWSVAARPREVLEPGHASAYVLLQTLPGQPHTELRVRPRAHLAGLSFGRLGSLCHAQVADLAFSLALAAPAPPTAPPRANAGHSKQHEPH